MSRVRRTADGTVAVAVDQARDLFDFGPLKTDAPDYNRLENPAYPVPVRARLLAPLGNLDLGRAFTGIYAGGRNGAAKAFVDDYAANVMPAFKRSIGLNSFHPWNHGPLMSDQNLRKQVDVGKQLGLETFMLDDQWQGGPDGESGDWRFDPARYPDKDRDKQPDFVEYLHAKGIKLGLWMSPAEFHGRSHAFLEHPDWACVPTGHLTSQYDDEVGFGVWDLTNPGLRAHLLSTIDRLVKDYRVVEFKFDFMAWVDCGTHDYADYEDAYVSLVHEMQVRHPKVTFETDETNDQRLWAVRSTSLGPSWFDNGHLHGSTKTAKLLHDLWTAAPWLPTSTIGMGLYDGTLGEPASARFLMPLALLSHLTFWTDLTKLSAADRAETKWWLRWYAGHRGDLGGVAAELTPGDPIGGKAWLVLQPRGPRHSYVFAFRQAGSATQRIALAGADAHRRYALTDVRTGRRVAVTARGGAVTLRLPAYGAQVLAVAAL
jgi:hypothetical protein